MVSDQQGTPTWTVDVSTTLVRLLETRPEGLFHYAARGYTTRYDTALAILEKSGLTGKTLTPCRTADFPSPARRPLNSRFACPKLENALEIERPPWQESLARFLRTSQGLRDKQAAAAS